MVQPIDQGAILASGRNLVPDYAAMLVRDRMLGIQEQEAETNATRTRLAAEEQRREAEEDARLQQAIAGLGENPTAADFARLMMRFPRFSEALRRGWETTDEAQRRSDFQQMAEVHDAARGGDYALAARLLRARVDADTAAGQEPDPMSEAILRGLESDDPGEQQFARDALERSVAAIAGPEQYSSVYGTFTRRTGVVDDIVYDQDTGQPLFQSPYPRIIPGENGSFYVQPRVSTIPVLGGGAAPPGEAGGQAPPASPAEPQAEGTSATGGSSPTALFDFRGWQPTSRPGDARDGGARRHAGHDFAPTGDRRIRAQRPFEVIAVRSGGNAGNTATIRFDNGETVDIMHLASLPRVGHRGNAGDVVAMAGETGNATGVNVHVQPARGPVSVRSVQQAQRLAPGTRYTTPDGREFVR